jgi:hypothetical protein
MAMDTFNRNFPYTSVVVPPIPPNLGTSLTVPQGHSVRFPAPPFNVTIWPQALPSTVDNAEIVRVTAINNDVWTIVRVQEGSAPRAIEVTDQIAQTLTVKALNDLKADLNAYAAGQASTAQTNAQNWVTAQDYSTRANVEQRIQDYWNQVFFAAAQNWVNAQGFALATWVEQRIQDYWGAIYQPWVVANFAPLWPRVHTDWTAGWIQPNCDTTDLYNIWGLDQNIGIAAPVGTAHEGQPLIIRIRDDSIAHAIGWETGSPGWMSHNQYAPLPTATPGTGQTINMGFRYNGIWGRWALLSLTVG